MAHVELSWTESPAPPIPRAAVSTTRDWNTLDRWSAVVETANEPCVVIDSFANIAAASLSASDLLGFGSPVDAIGQCLYDHALPLLDFTSEGGNLPQEEIQRIPPILALTSGLLARGVLRIRTALDIVTMDAVSTPLVEGDVVVGSLTFFSVV